jgi:hypothetical protein
MYPYITHTYNVWTSSPPSDHNPMHNTETKPCHSLLSYLSGRCIDRPHVPLTHVRFWNQVLSSLGVYSQPREVWLWTHSQYLQAEHKKEWPILRLLNSAILNTPRHCFMPMWVYVLLLQHPLPIYTTSQSVLSHFQLTSFGWFIRIYLSLFISYGNIISYLWLPNLCPLFQECEKGTKQELGVFSVNNRKNIVACLYATSCMQLAPKATFSTGSVGYKYFFYVQCNCSVAATGLCLVRVTRCDC